MRKQRSLPGGNNLAFKDPSICPVASVTLSAWKGETGDTRVGQQVVAMGSLLCEAGKLKEKWGDWKPLEGDKVPTRAHSGWTTCPLGEAWFPLSGAKPVFFLIPAPTGSGSHPVCKPDLLWSPGA